MVHILKRMRKLREILWIRVGPGALLLPKEVTKISMEFNRKLYGGHRGARKFWREMLPRIKFRNPTVPIQISRHEDPDGPSLLRIYTSANDTATTTTATPTHALDIRNKPESEILDMLIVKTGAVIINATPEELQELEELREARARSEKDRQIVRDHLTRERKEQELLRLARGEVPSTN